MPSSTAAPTPRDALTVGAISSFSARWLKARVDEARVVPIAAVAVAVAYVAMGLGRNWMPWDDGALGHAAERVLRGEMPHRDFDDIYTGGLAYLNAGAFGLLGPSLWTLRVVLLAFVVAWVPAVYYIASRFLRPAAAAVATFLAVAWSIPNYPAAMPSWYNLFFATFGAAALLRYLDVRRKRWLVAAGLAGGLSFLVKVVGLYYVAGALLFLVYQAQAESRAVATTSTHRASGYALFVSAALTLFVAALVMLVRQQLHPPELIHFVLPTALVVALVVWNEWRVPAAPTGGRFAALARTIGPFLLGVVIPIALFLLPYVWTGTLGTVVNGVFVLPTKRFAFASHRGLPPVWSVLALIPFLALAIAARSLHGRSPRASVVLLAIGLGALFVATLASDAAYRLVWYAARYLPLFLAAVVVMIAWNRATGAEDSLWRARAVLLVAVTAMSALLQYPFSLAVYFCYVAPLVVLAAAAVFRLVPRMPIVVPGAFAAFYLVFAVTRVNGAPLSKMGESYRPPEAVEPLAIPRAGIDIPVYQAAGYRELITALRERARGGYTWASPDSPEIYFLSGLGNPTRSLFDFFDDPRQRADRVLGALDAHGVTAVVLNRFPSFSPDLRKDPVLLAELLRRYPLMQDFGSFELRWRP